MNLKRSILLLFILVIILSAIVVAVDPIPKSGFSGGTPSGPFGRGSALGRSSTQNDFGLGVIWEFISSLRNNEGRADALLWILIFILYLAVIKAVLGLVHIFKKGDELSKPGKIVAFSLAGIFWIVSLTGVGQIITTGARGGASSLNGFLGGWIAFMIYGFIVFVLWTPLVHGATMGAENRKWFPWIFAMAGAAILGANTDPDMHNWLKGIYIGIFWVCFVKIIIMGFSFGLTSKALGDNPVSRAFEESTHRGGGVGGFVERLFMESGRVDRDAPQEFIEARKAFYELEKETEEEITCIEKLRKVQNKKIKFYKKLGAWNLTGSTHMIENWTKFIEEKLPGKIDEQIDLVEKFRTTVQKADNREENVSKLHKLYTGDSTTIAPLSEVNLRENYDLYKLHEADQNMIQLLNQLTFQITKERNILIEAGDAMAFVARHQDSIDALLEQEKTMNSIEKFMDYIVRVFNIVKYNEKKFKTGLLTHLENKTTNEGCKLMREGIDSLNNASQDDKNKFEEARSKFEEARSKFEEAQNRFASFFKPANTKVQLSYENWGFQTTVDKLIAFNNFCLNTTTTEISLIDNGKKILGTYIIPPLSETDLEQPKIGTKKQQP